MKPFLIILALLIANPVVAQTQLVCNQGSAKVPCTAPIGQTYIPTGIPATKIAGGTVSDAVFGYLAGAASSIQAQINDLVSGAVALSNATPPAVGTAAAGMDTTAARADHVHALPAVGTAGTSSYATVTTDAQGRVTALSAGTAPSALSSTMPANVGTAAIGVSTTAARADHIHALPTTAVSAGSYPTVGQIPTFAVDANGRLTATGSTTTLTSPSISGPVITGTEGGTRTIGGTPTLGVNLAAGGFKITGLGAPAVASSDSATAAYAEAQKTGGTVITFAQSNANTWGASHYIGLTGAASGATPWVAPVPFTIPSDGIIKVLRVASNFAAPGANTVDIYRNTGGGGFVATTITAAMASSSAGVDTTHSVNVLAGDLIIPFNNGALWNHLGVSVSLRYIPNQVP